MEGRKWKRMAPGIYRAEGNRPGTFYMVERCAGDNWFASVQVNGEEILFWFNAFRTLAAAKRQLQSWEAAQ